MKLMGFNFTKISVEKFPVKPGKVKINTKIDVPDINSVKSDIITPKEDLIGAKFTFDIEYEPGIAKIELAGHMLLALEPKIAKDVLKQWEDKKLPEDFKLSLFNLILKKSTLKALQLEEELNLPLHMQLPSFTKNDPKEDQ
jgi:hypothetical protein